MTEKTSVTAPKAETPTWARPPDALPSPLVISLGVRLQDVKRIAWAVDQAAEVAVARLVNQPRQGLAEVPDSVDDRLQQNNHEADAER